MWCFSLQVVILQDFKWYDFILNLHKIYNGTYLTVKNVTSRRLVISFKNYNVPRFSILYFNFLSPTVCFMLETCGSRGEETIIELDLHGALWFSFLSSFCLRKTYTQTYMEMLYLPSREALRKVILLNLLTSGILMYPQPKLESYMIILFSLLNLCQRWWTQLIDINVTHPWLNIWLSMISHFSSTSLKFIVWQWCPFLNQNFLFLLLSLFVCNATIISLLFCCSSSVRSIEVEEVSCSGSIYVQSDGEHLGFLPRKFHILPAAIEMICWTWAPFCRERKTISKSFVAVGSFFSNVDSSLKLE